jgi:hypothetical protein
MFSRDEALALWDDLVADKDAFLLAFGEVVFTRMPKMIPLGSKPKEFGYFVRARNYCFTKEMFMAYNRICEKHNCSYRVETDAPEILFYRPGGARE